MNCTTHPTYQVKRAPRGNCTQCWIMWLEAEVKRLFGTPGLEMMDKSRTRLIAEAIYEAECKRLGKRANCWDTHEEDCIRYWENVIILGQKAWWQDENKQALEINAVQIHELTSQ